MRHVPDSPRAASCRDPSTSANFICLHQSLTLSDTLYAVLEERKAKLRQRLLGHPATAIALSRDAKMHEVVLDGASRGGEIGHDNKIGAKLRANEGLFDRERCLLANVCLL
jgi:hypothetical protein